jgi:UDP-4-amino-4,6-dideoxy-N-acetyl-beta-L-altrosamine transaminase
VVVNSATSALHIACKALGVGPGDTVWTSAVTFVASANCALYCGASVDFVDIDPLSYNMSIESLSEKLELANLNNTLPKVLIPVHLSGQSCDMQEIHLLSQKYGFSIIEDASHAIGGSYLDEPVGNCQYSDISVFSFHPVKIITSGEGGAALTNNKDLANSMKLLSTHGITRDASQMEEEADGPWYYEQILLGSNYRMTELQAALGLNQLGRIDHFVKRRHKIARKYDENLSCLPLCLPTQSAKTFSSYHLYIIRLKLDEITKSHKQVFKDLISAGLGVNLHYIPVYHHPFYQKQGFTKGYCPQAEKYYQEAISIPMFYGLNEELQDQVIKLLKENIF